VRSSVRRLATLPNRPRVRSKRATRLLINLASDPGAQERSFDEQCLEPVDVCTQALVDDRKGGVALP